MCDPLVVTHELEYSAASLMGTTCLAEAGSACLRVDGSLSNTSATDSDNIEARSNQSLSLTYGRGLNAQTTLGGTLSITPSGSDNNGFDMGRTVGLSLWGAYSESGQLGTGWQASASVGRNTGTADISRGRSLENVIVSTGSADVTTNSMQATLGYGVQRQDWLFTPSATLTRYTTTRDAYSESGGDFNATYDSLSVSSTTLDLQLAADYRVSDTGTLMLEAGMVKDLNVGAITLTGTSDIPGMTAVSTDGGLERNDTRGFASIGYRHVLNDSSSLTGALQKPVAKASIDDHSFKAAVAVYLRLKGHDRPPTFEAAVRRSCGYLIDCCGMKQLKDYRRTDATKFRDYLFAKVLNGASVARVFGTVRAVINLALSEFGLAIVNPFSNVYFNQKEGVKKRLPVKPEDIKKVKAECYKADDEMRWLVALVADTGIRLAEGAGLLRSDFITRDGILCVSIKPHPWRSLKTASSERVIPLVGSAKWAAERILEHPNSSQFAFPKYNDGQRTNANSASAALNKWLKVKIGEGYTMHSFRHSMRDRLRAVECPSDIIDQIGGWLTQGVGAAYGEGYSVGMLQKWMHSL